MDNIRFQNPMGEVYLFLNQTLSVFFQKEKIKSFTIVIALLFSFFPKEINAQCDFSNGISCNGSLNGSVGINCTYNVNPSLIISNYQTFNQLCQDSLAIHIVTENGVFIGEGHSFLIDINTNPLVSIGDSINVSGFHDLNGNDMLDSNEPNCWTGIRLEDKLSPTISNCDDVTVYCFDNLANVAGGPIVPITATDNCSSNVTITLADSVMVTNDCATDPNVAGVLTKKWYASDEFGNVDSCTQTITILRIPTTGMTIEPPMDVTLECNSSNPPSTSPDDLGYPTITFTDINGQEVTIELTPAATTGLCGSINVLPHVDIPFTNMCGNSEKIQRTFDVFDWCANGGFGTSLGEVSQIIEIADTQGPTFTCPSDMTIGTSSNSCSGSTLLPAVTATDVCGSTPFSYLIETPAGNLTENGGLISGLAYTVTDDCGQMTSCSFTITVEDDDAPNPVCESTTVVALTNNGEAYVPAMTFDDGSTDNCGIVNYEVRRMATNCSPTSNFASQVFFDCCDVNDTIMVELKLTDAAGNMNSCMVEVVVQDKIGPTIACPSNVTIECGADTSALALGMAIGFDNCGTPTISYSDQDNRDPDCGTGTILRTWTVTDDEGFSDGCTQVIEVINSDPFSGNSDPNDIDDIIFPPNVMNATAISCVDYQNDPTLTDASNTGVPTLVGENETCSNIAMFGPVDFVAYTGAGDCSGFKIFRKWGFVDWCQRDTPPDFSQNETGVWVHTQVIEVVDNDAPVLSNAPGDITLSVDNNCEYTVTNADLPTIAQSDISDCNDDIDISISTNFGGDGQLPETVGLGTYQVTYTLDDGCGNTTSHTINVTVADNKPPTPFCQGLSFPLMMVLGGNGMLTVDAGMFVLNSSEDNCTDFSDLDFTIELAEGMNPTIPATDTELTFTCANVDDTVAVAVWVCDDAMPTANCTFCTVNVLVTAPSGACTGNATAMSGLIDTEMGAGVEEVEVMINNGQFMEMTNVDGEFSVGGLPMFNNYNIKPHKNNEPRNGVTTFDIVKISLTALDLAHIRNLILLNVDEFPNGMPSWRFVCADFVFQNPIDPFEDDFPEAMDIQNLNSDLEDLNFVAIKLGDVTNNATTNLLATDTRTTSGEIEFITQNRLVKKGEVVELVFETKNQKALAAWQYTLSFKKELVEFLNIEKEKEVHFGTSKMDEGVITLNWNDVKNTDLKDKLLWFKIYVEAKEDFEIRNVFNINSSYTRAIAYNENGEEYDIQLLFDNQNTEQNETGLILFPNSPNPFTTETQINYYLPKEDEIDITVFDMTGKLLKTYSVFSASGRQSFTIRKDDFDSSGLLYYQIRTSEHKKSGKMILQR